jgi:1-acyl-sn-glycerol-3-phosphate acyltransferase
MVAKTELYRVPIFGPAMTAAGFIEIDRSNRERAIASLEIAKQRLAQGVSVWIAPEGTRSRTGELLPFKKGGFMLAMDTALPILPVGIVGSRDILPANGRLVQKGVRVHVAIQAPIEPPPPDAASTARDELMNRVRSAIERGVREARGALDGSSRINDAP